MIWGFFYATDVSALPPVFGWLALPLGVTACTSTPCASGRQCGSGLVAPRRLVVPAKAGDGITSCHGPDGGDSLSGRSAWQLCSASASKAAPKAICWLVSDCVARGVLYAPSQQGQLYTLHPQQATLQAVGTGGLARPPVALAWISTLR